MAENENKFQADLISEIETRFPDCLVLKNDPNYIQGIPDLLVLKDDKWAALECKKNSKAKRRPNQEHYVTKMNGMSYAAFIYPENKEDILNELSQSFES